MESESRCKLVQLSQLHARYLTKVLGSEDTTKRRIALDPLFFDGWSLYELVQDFILLLL